MALFESYERRIDKINAVLNSYGIASLEEAEKSQRCWTRCIRPG
ncbi:MAG: GGGtGRT protein [Eisenbergiella sp.]